MTRIILSVFTVVLMACTHNRGETVVTTSATIPAQRTATPVWSPAPQVDSSQMPFDLPKTLIREPRQTSRAVDARAVAAVQRAILAAPSLSAVAKAVEVTAVDGVVTLRGRVESVQERDELLRIARATPDVRRVEGEIRIAP